MKDVRMRKKQEPASETFIHRIYIRERITNMISEFYNNYYDVKQTNYLKGEWAWNEFFSLEGKTTIAEV